MYDTSIVIPCHNAESTLGLQLESLFYQRDAEEFEIVIVDNLSTDQTIDVAKNWSDRLNIKVVTATEHGGVAYARNFGVSSASGTKILFLDSDDVSAPHLVSNAQRILNDNKIFSGAFVPVPTSKFISVESALDTIQEFDEEPSTLKVDQNWPILPGCVFGIQKKYFLELGGFDISTEPGAEDNDFGLRSAKYGILSPISNSTVIAYRVYPEAHRGFRMYFYRALSVSLVITRNDRWTTYKKGKTRFSPILDWGKCVLSSSKLIKKPDTYDEWIKRFFLQSGILFGWLKYQIFRQIPECNIGFGLSSEDRKKRIYF